MKDEMWARLREHRIAQDAAELGDVAPRTPGRRAASVEQTASENQRDIAKLQSQIDEQSALITGQRAAIEELRVVFEEVAQGARHLAGRIDKEEKARKAGDRATLQRTQLAQDRLHKQVIRVAVDASGVAGGFQSRLNRLEAQAKRVREQFPQVATQTTEEDNDD